MAGLIDRIARLEAAAVPPSTGKHLTFQVEASQGTPTGDIVTFLRERGHAIHPEDQVFVMNLGAHLAADGDPIRDLSHALLTEEDRAAAPAAGRWPKGSEWFTFTLDSPRLHA
ncbi:hypothetical protein MKK69_26225 [Methylobacterium sp. J-026]|uniref:hypothetical protein n=1 Tax=Methylobacterium sp. J-026 TaxID=2836624 RepID=UPI001FBBA4A7|nr:hypothetical protein [Methylobacterium sp. J-026]MCJ2137498.1 hypothetical protein [Methylobacterium sp. J-026]